MMERLLDVEVSEHGMIIEEIELLCCMTGFRRRFLVEHMVDGFHRSVEVFWVPGWGPALGTAGRRCFKCRDETRLLGKSKATRRATNTV
jgi:hypothetical protein